MNQLICYFLMDCFLFENVSNIITIGNSERWRHFHEIFFIKNLIFSILYAYFFLQIPNINGIINKKTKF